MKNIEIEYSKLQYLMVDALDSAPLCPFKNDKCKIKRDWNHQDSSGKNKIIISGSLATPLSDYINSVGYLRYVKTSRLAICLGIQLSVLTDYGYGLPYLTMDDIIVIDENWFLLTNLSKVIRMNKEKQLTITKPLPSEGFIAPEVKSITQLPHSVDQSCIYYSVALLCSSVYGFNDIILNKEFDLEIIKTTPLYFFLKRCLHEDPAKRTFLLI